jgi:subtilisin family serine protease
MNNMQVINMSLGMSTHVQALQDAVNAADNTGVVIVAAAGNSGDGDATTNNVGYPAKYSSVIAVAATDSADRIATFSSDGAEVEIAAPGVNINSTTRGGGYGAMNGTSMAAPHVAGVVASMLAAPITAGADTNQDALWSTGEARAYLQTTSDGLGAAGRDVFFGYGLVDSEESTTGIQTQ